MGILRNGLTKKFEENQLHENGRKADFEEVKNINLHLQKTVISGFFLGGALW